ncbi:MAG TPA: hypothetical protein LFW20_02395 [Rickettsia endosymbiont of Omalisus fontisbellaquei]|nr:hypothetical protein [Rickettsia endosymbiont of Omalisus fontisbellaquei]
MKTEKFFQKNASNISSLGYTEFENTFLLLKLLEESPLAWKILQYAAYLDPDFINVNIFKELLLVDEEKLQEPIKRLEELGLISIWHQNGIDGLMLHKSLQDSVKNYAKRHKEKLKKLEAINSIYKNDIDALPLKKLLQDSVHKRNVIEEKEIYARIVSVLNDYFSWLPNVPNLDQENSKPLLNYRE